MVGDPWASEGSSEASLATLVQLGLTRRAVQRVRQAPTPLTGLHTELTRIRAGGHGLEADVLHLVATNRAAAELLGPLDPGRGGTGRLVLSVMFLAWLLLTAVHPLLGLLVPAVGVALVVRWFRSRRRQLDEREWRILVSWFKANLPRHSAEQRHLALTAALVLGCLAVPLGIKAPGVGITFGLLAVGLTLIALLPTGGKSAEPSAGPTNTPEPATHRPSPVIRPAPAPSIPAAVTPLVVRRPPVPAAVVPVVVALTLVFTLTNHLSPAVAVAWSTATGAVAVLLRWRAGAYRLVVDERGLTHHGLLRTRRFPWRRIAGLVVKDDSGNRVRLEVVSDTGEHTAVWFGDVDDPVLVDLVAHGEQLAAGVDHSRRRGAGCLTAFLVCLSLFAALCTLIALTTHNDATVDPAEVPAGIDIWVGSRAEEGGPANTWVDCAAPLDDRPAWEPESCAGSRRAQLWWTFGFGGVTVASSVASVVLIRARRREDALSDAGPIVAGPRP